jgi:hypothetical protein
MNEHVRIQDLSAAEIAAAIAASHAELSMEELLAVEEFVDRIGGIRNAQLAIDMLYKLEDAA